MTLINKKTINTILVFFLILAGLELLTIGFAATLTNSTIMTVFITNTAPNITFTNVTPNPALPGNTLTFNANITDANGDPLTATIIYYNTTGANISGAAISVLFDGTYYTNNTFILPAHADPGVWHVNITVSDGITTVVNETTFNVSSVLSSTLQNTPIDFGNQTVGQIAQRAQNGTAVAGKYSAIVAGFPLMINNTGNIAANYSINGTDLTGVTDVSKVIAVGNVTWNVTDTGAGSRAGKIALTNAAPATIANSVSGGNTQNVYFWIDTPNGVTQQQYNGTVVFVTTG